MDSTIAAGLVAAAAALVGAGVGGLITLITSERGVRATLLAHTLERQTGYRAAVEAAKRELTEDKRVIDLEYAPALKAHLQRAALDTLLAFQDFEIPSAVIEVAQQIAFYNSLVSLSLRALDAGNQPPVALMAQFASVTRATAASIEEASARLAALSTTLTSPEMRAWAENLRKRLRELQPRSPWARLWDRLTTPRSS